MNISAGYPNTSHKRLLYNLRKKKVNYKVDLWIASFLGNWHDIVKTNKHTRPKLSIGIDLPQKSPLSSIFSLINNADLQKDSV